MRDFWHPEGKTPVEDEKPRFRASTNDLLVFVAVRRTLTTVAELATHLNRDEFERFTGTLVDELNALTFNGDHADVWKQAVEAAKLDGMAQYGLQRIGLHPTEKADVPEPEPKRRRRRK